MMINWTILDAQQVAVRHETFPRGVTPSGNVIEGHHPLGMQFAFGEWRPFTPPVITPAPITSITPRQARLALLQAGLLEQVQAAFAQIPEPQRTAAQIEWDHALSVERDSPLTQQMAAALGLTDEQLNNLFTEGAKL